MSAFDAPPARSAKSVEQCYTSANFLQAQDETCARVPAEESAKAEDISRLWKHTIKQTIQCANAPGAYAWLGFGTGVLVYLSMDQVDRSNMANLLPFVALTAGCAGAGLLLRELLPISVLTFVGIRTMAKMRL